MAHSSIVLESQISVLGNYFHDEQTAWKRLTIFVPVIGSFILTKDCSVTEWQGKEKKRKKLIFTERIDLKRGYQCLKTGTENLTFILTFSR